MHANAYTVLPPSSSNATEAGFSPQSVHTSFWDTHSHGPVIFSAMPCIMLVGLLREPTR